jgi:hypothetical protein
MTNFVGCILISAWFGSNRMVLPPTQHEIQWQSSEECFLNTSSLVSETLTGLHARLIYQHAIFFLWGYLKEKVYAHRPHTLQQLKDYIREEIQEIPVNMLRKVMDNVRQRAEMCVKYNRAHLSDIIFKT